MTDELNRMSRFLMTPAKERSKLAAPNLEGFLTGRAPGGDPVTFAMHGADFFAAMTKSAAPEIEKRAGTILDHDFETRHSAEALSARLSNDPEKVLALSTKLLPDPAKPAAVETQVSKVQDALRGLASKSETTKTAAGIGVLDDVVQGGVAAAKAVKKSRGARATA